MKLYDKRDDFNFPIVNVPFTYVATFQLHLHMEYIALNCSDIPELVDFLDRGLTKDSYLLG